MPDVTGLVWILGPHSNGTASHLVAEHKTADKAR